MLSSNLLLSLPASEAFLCHLTSSVFFFTLKMSIMFMLVRFRIIHRKYLAGGRISTK